MSSDVPVTVEATVDAVAAAIDPGRARLACALIMASLGAYESWSSEHLEWIAGDLIPVRQGTGLPSFVDQDADAIEFWQRVIDA